MQIAIEVSRHKPPNILKNAHVAGKNPSYLWDLTIFILLLYLVAISFINHV